MISNCCGAENRSITPDGPDWEDIGMCPECREHCDWEEEERPGFEAFFNKMMKEKEEEYEY